MKSHTSPKFVSRLMAAARMLEASKKYASPTQWARVHDIQSRLATCMGLRRAFNVKRKTSPRKRRAKKES